jgi:hypothetical protein
VPVSGAVPAPLPVVVHPLSQPLVQPGTVPSQQQVQQLTTIFFAGVTPVADTHSSCWVCLRSSGASWT